MASITEVARRAGVSITTVSRVLNPVSEYPVAAATRRRVLAAAQALQHSPSALARALVTRRSRMIGVLLGDISDPYFAEIVRGIEDGTWDLYSVLSSQSLISTRRPSSADWYAAYTTRIASRPSAPSDNADRPSATA